LFYLSDRNNSKSVILFYVADLKPNLAYLLMPFRTALLTTLICQGCTLKSGTGRTSVYLPQILSSLMN